MGYKASGNCVGVDWSTKQNTEEEQFGKESKSNGEEYHDEFLSAINKEKKRSTHIQKWDSSLVCRGYVLCYKMPQLSTHGRTKQH